MTTGWSDWPLGPIPPERGFAAAEAGLPDLLAAAPGALERAARVVADAGGAGDPAGRRVLEALARATAPGARRVALRALRGQAPRPRARAPTPAPAPAAPVATAPAAPAAPAATGQPAPAAPGPPPAPAPTSAAWSAPFEALLTGPTQAGLAEAALALADLDGRLPPGVGPDDARALAARIALAAVGGETDPDGAGLDPELARGLSRLARGLGGLRPA